VGGGGSTGFHVGTSLRCQLPNTFSAMANASSLEMSPTMPRIMLFGTKYWRWNARRSSCVMRASDDVVPLPGFPYGWNP